MFLIILRSIDFHRIFTIWLKQNLWLVYLENFCQFVKLKKLWQKDALTSFEKASSRWRGHVKKEVLSKYQIFVIDVNTSLKIYKKF